jgi:hypothetical protein
MCTLGAIVIAIIADVSTTATTTPTAAANPLATRAGTAPTTVAAPPAPTTIASDGTHLVPAEARPGTYRATVPADSFGCYWARLKGTSGNFEDIIGNGNGDAGGRMTVTIRTTDKAFQTEGCGTWVKIS